MRLGTLALVGLISDSSWALRYPRSPEQGLNSNGSNITTSYHFAPSLVGTHPLTGTATPSPTPNKTIAANDLHVSCSGQTLNVLDASLDYWHSRTLYNYVSTISIQYNRNDSRTGWTLLPATTQFNLTSALTSPVCTSTPGFNTNYNITTYKYDCHKAPTPVAAETTIISQTAFRPLNASTGTGRVPDVIVTPPPPTLTLPNSKYPEKTPVVHFSSYEIVTKSLVNNGSGSMSCATSTQTHVLQEPASFEYTDGNVDVPPEEGAEVTGNIKPLMLQSVGAANARAGSYVAKPTVVLVVQDVMVEEAVLAVQQAGGPKMVPLMMTQTILQTPSATLPDIHIPKPPKTTQGAHNHQPPGGGFANGVQKTDSRLDVPTRVGKPQKTPGEKGKPAHGGNPPKGGNAGHGKGGKLYQGNNGKPAPIGHHGNRPNQGNSGQPAPGGHHGNKPNQGNSGKPGFNDNQGGQQNQGNGGRIGHFVSAIMNAVKPKNALQVFQQAHGPAKANPTAHAIENGVGGGKRPDGRNGHGNGAGFHAGGSSGRANGVGTGPKGVPFVVVDGTTYDADSSTHFNLGAGAALTPGGTAVVGGATVSLMTKMKGLVVDGETFPAGPAITPAPVLTIDGKTYEPNAGTTYNIDGQQLTPGGVITVDGTTISLQPGASAVVVDGVTKSLGNPNAASITAAPALTIGGKTFTAKNGDHTYIINGETLTPGAEETVSVNGKTYIASLYPGGRVLMLETLGPNGKVTASSYQTLLLRASATTTTTKSFAHHAAEASAGAKASSTTAPSPSAKSKENNASSTCCVAVGVVLGSFFALAALL